MRTFPDLKPLSEPPLKAVLDQLGCVYRNAPLWPGDTLSHEIARRCRDLGFIRRNKPGNWVPTRLGSVVYWLGHRWTKRTTSSKLINRLCLACRHSFHGRKKILGRWLGRWRDCEACFLTGWDCDGKSVDFKDHVPAAGTAEYVECFVKDYSNAIASCEADPGLAPCEVIVSVRFKWWYFMPGRRKSMRIKLEETITEHAIPIGFQVEVV